MKRTFTGMTAACLMAATIMLAGCGSSNDTTIGATPPPAVNNATATTIDGSALYAADCAGCHGPLASSTKRGATAALIQTGISTIGAMNSLSALSTQEIQAIANALNGTSTTTFAPATTTTTMPTTTTTPPASTPTPIDGTSLYAADCAGCHGPLASSTKLGASAALIQTGISTIGAMSSLSSLTPAQIQAIATALAPSTTAPTTAPTPTATVPAAPTGATAAGGTGQVTISTTTATAALDGAALYASYCAGCHGPLATSSKRQATAAQIQTGIMSVGAMKSLSTLTAAQVHAIAAALNF
jgi:mono/diheme cytochrome c family protein